MRIRIETEKHEAVGEAVEINRLITDYEFSVEETTNNQTVSEVIDNHIKKHSDYHKTHYGASKQCVD